MISEKAGNEWGKRIYTSKKYMRSNSKKGIKKDQLKSDLKSKLRKDSKYLISKPDPNLKHVKSSLKKKLKVQMKEKSIPKENKTGINLKISKKKKKEIGVDKINKAIKAFAERSKKIDKKVIAIKRQSRNTSIKKNISRPKSKNHSTQKNYKNNIKTDIIYNEYFHHNENLIRNKISLDSIKNSHQSSKIQCSIPSTMREMETSGKSTIGKWKFNQSNLNIRPNQKINKKLLKVNKTKKKEQKSIKKFISPERIKNILLKDKHNNNKASLFQKYSKRANSKNKLPDNNSNSIINEQNSAKDNILSKKIHFNISKFELIAKNLSNFGMKIGKMYGNCKASQYTSQIIAFIYYILGRFN